MGIHPVIASATTDVIVAFATVAQVLTTVILALVLNSSAKRIARLEFGRGLRESWIDIDQLALADDANLRIANALLVPKEGATGEFARKRWLILAYLNPIVTLYEGAHSWFYGSRKTEMLDALEGQLRPLLRDEDAYWVTQNHGHEESFKNFCKKIREEVK